MFESSTRLEKAKRARKGLEKCLEAYQEWKMSGNSTRLEKAKKLTKARECPEVGHGWKNIRKLIKGVKS